MAPESPAVVDLPAPPGPFREAELPPHPTSARPDPGVDGPTAAWEIPIDLAPPVRQASPETGSPVSAPSLDVFDLGDREAAGGHVAPPRAVPPTGWQDVPEGRVVIAPAGRAARTPPARPESAASEADEPSRWIAPAPAAPVPVEPAAIDEPFVVRRVPARRAPAAAAPRLEPPVPVSEPSRTGAGRRVALILSVVVAVAAGAAGLVFLVRLLTAAPDAEAPAAEEVAAASPAPSTPEAPAPAGPRFGELSVLGQDASALRSGEPLLVAFRDGGLQLASAGGATGGVRLWDAASGREARPLGGGGGAGSRVIGLRFSPDGAYLAAALESPDPVVRVWDVESGRELIRNQMEEPVDALGVGSTGHLRILSGSVLRSWSLPAADLVEERRLDGWPAADSIRRPVLVSPDGSRVALATPEGIRFWDVSRGPGPNALAGTAGERVLDFRGDSRYLAAAAGAEVYVWDLVAGGAIRVLKGHSAAVTAGAFSADGTLLATAAGGEVVLWDVAAGAALDRASAGSATSGLGFDSGATRLAAGTDAGLRGWTLRRVER